MCEGVQNRLLSILNIKTFKDLRNRKESNKIRTNLKEHMGSSDSDAMSKFIVSIKHCEKVGSGRIGLDKDVDTSALQQHCNNCYFYNSYTLPLYVFSLVINSCLLYSISCDTAYWPCQTRNVATNQGKAKFLKVCSTVYGLMTVKHQS